VQKFSTVFAHGNVGRKLTGARCRCSACGECFNSVTVFDAHRAGSYEVRRCLTVIAMTARGWLHNDAGFWIRCEKADSGLHVTRRSGDRLHPATYLRPPA
jgi:hypothetical protein